MLICLFFWWNFWKVCFLKWEVFGFFYLAECFVMVNVLVVCIRFFVVIFLFVGIFWVVLFISILYIYIVLLVDSGCRVNLCLVVMGFVSLIGFVGVFSCWVLVRLCRVMFILFFGWMIKNGLCILVFLVVKYFG